MSATSQPLNELSTRSQLFKYAVTLLSQQIWCWGCDIMRPEGNWLIEIGFNRIEPPDNRKDCPSVYSLELPRGQSVVLRGFGVFFGDSAHGGIFVPRYEFQPKYTKSATLDRPPWSDEDLPIGLQIIGKPFDEGRILRLGYAYEQAVGARRPPGF